MSSKAYPESSNIVPIGTDLSNYWETGNTSHDLNEGQVPALAHIDMPHAMVNTDNSPPKPGAETAQLLSQLSPEDRASALGALLAGRSARAREAAAKREQNGLSITDHPDYGSNVIPLHRSDN